MKYAAIIISWLLAWPVFFLYYLSSKKELILKDAERNISYRRTKLNGVNAVIYLFVVDKYFRTFFYHRIGKTSFLISWLWRKSAIFFPLCKDVGGGIYLAHPYATILNAKKIGDNFTCRQNTTLGNKSDNETSKKPTIGNNVTLGANVVIIGDIEIGDNSIIGAGCVVTKNIPTNSVVVGNPARIIKTL